MLGVQSRFGDSEETKGRFKLATTIIPPVAMMTLDYPMMGAGTGRCRTPPCRSTSTRSGTAELELHRYLVELGPVGFMFAWVVKLGLMVAFYRASKILKRAGRRACAGAALSYAAVTFFGHLTFDHIWQSLYFVCAGFILAETKAALETLKERARAAKPAQVDVDVGPPPVSLRA